MGFFIVDFGTAYAATATVGVTELLADGTVSVARTTAGINNLGNGAFGISLTPATLTKSLRWDTGGATPVYAIDDSVQTASTTDVAAAVMQYAVEVGWSTEQLLRVFAAVLAGKVSGAGTGTEIFRGILDDKNRVTATTDVNGNRSAITLNGS